MTVTKKEAKIYEIRKSAFERISNLELKQSKRDEQSLKKFLEFFEAVYKVWLKNGYAPESDWMRVKSKIEFRKKLQKIDGHFKPCP